MPFFIEVGACDFDTCEQLIKNGWKGIVIEPVKYYFNKLPKYAQINYENLAISDQDGETKIHYIDPERITNESEMWLKGISTLKGKTGPMSIEGNKELDHFKKCLQQNVRTTTLNKICEKYEIQDIDFLKIDTEGHDLIVLKSLNLEKVNVRFIKIEHKHLDKKEIISYLEQYNYLIYVENDDIYAIK